MPRNKNPWGPAFVGIAAFLWATDALFRVPLLGTFDPLAMVGFEHLLGVLVLLPYVLVRFGKSVFRLSPKEWAAAVFVGVGGSALATVFFTASFQYVNPSLAILLQKLQPVFVVLIAFVILGERPEKRFFVWAPVALAAALVLSFPDLDFGFLRKGIDLHSKGIIYSLSAAGLWAISTVFGKMFLQRQKPSLATFWRFFFGLLALAVLLFLAEVPTHWQALLSSQSILLGLIYISLLPGLVAMLFYYAGLSNTPASVTTFIELIYPVSAVVLNYFFLKTSLEPVQLVSGAVLLYAVTKIAI